MQPETIEALMKAFYSLQVIIDELYTSFQEAVDNGNDADATLLEARADRLYEEAETLLAVIMEYRE
jgi:3-dehydroquinate dehydratase